MAAVMVEVEEHGEEAPQLGAVFMYLPGRGTPSRGRGAPSPRAPCRVRDRGLAWPRRGAALTRLLTAIQVAAGAAVVVMRTGIDGKEGRVAAAVPGAVPVAAVLGAVLEVPVAPPPAPGGAAVCVLTFGTRTARAVARGGSPTALPPFPRQTAAAAALVRSPILSRWVTHGWCPHGAPPAVRAALEEGGRTSCPRWGATHTLRGGGLGVATPHRLARPSPDRGGALALARTSRTRVRAIRRISGRVGVTMHTTSTGSTTGTDDEEVAAMVAVSRFLGGGMTVNRFGTTAKRRMSGLRPGDLSWPP